jgi:Peptidase inhibitor family I36
MWTGEPRPVRCQRRSVPRAGRRRREEIAVNRLGGAVAVSVLTVACGVAGAAAPAYAGPHSSCARGRVCLYENNDFNRGNTDHWRDFVSDHYDFRKLVWLDSNGSATNDHMDNETSSIKNRRGCRVRLWQNVGGTGASTTFNDNVDDGFLANNSIGDNRASAIDVCV